MRTLCASTMLLPFLGGEVERIRRQRLIGRRAERSLLEPLFARVIVVGDRLQPPSLRVIAEMVDV